MFLPQRCSCRLKQLLRIKKPFKWIVEASMWFQLKYDYSKLLKINFLRVNGKIQLIFGRQITAFVNTIVSKNLEVKYK